MARSGNVLPVGNADQVLPASGVKKMRLPGLPAIQHFGPRTASAERSNSAIPGGSVPTGGRHELPRLPVTAIQPPSPTSHPKPGGTTCMPLTPCKMTPAGGLREKSPSLIVAFSPRTPPRTAVRPSKKSPVDNRDPPPLHAGCQLLPASRVMKIPPGNIADEQPMAQPCRSLTKRILRRAGSSTGSRCQFNPPSRVPITIPELSCR